MNKVSEAISYTLAAVAGVTLVCGLVILTGEVRL